VSKISLSPPVQTVTRSDRADFPAPARPAAGGTRLSYRLGSRIAVASPASPGAIIPATVTLTGLGRPDRSRTGQAWVIVLGDQVAAAGDPVDDEFDLLRDAPGPTPPPRRPMWLLLGALVVVALLAVSGVVWMVSSASDRGARVTAAPVSSAAATTTAATSEPVPTTAPPLPTTTAAAPTATIPVQSAVTVVPSPTPDPTTKPAPRPTPVPRPTLSTPAGKLVAVPDVIGLRVQGATSVLQRAGLRVQVLGGVLVVDRDQRRVTAQRPTPGSIVRVGSTVILVTDGL
jgi:hypothetical protein